MEKCAVIFCCNYEAINCVLDICLVERLRPTSKPYSVEQVNVFSHTTLRPLVVPEVRQFSGTIRKIFITLTANMTFLHELSANSQLAPSLSHGFRVGHQVSLYRVWQCCGFLVKSTSYSDLVPCKCNNRERWLRVAFYVSFNPPDSWSPKREIQRQKVTVSILCKKIVFWAKRFKSRSFPVKCLCEVFDPLKEAGIIPKRWVLHQLPPSLLRRSSGRESSSR